MTINCWKLSLLLGGRLANNKSTVSALGRRLENNSSATDQNTGTREVVDRVSAYIALNTATLGVVAQLSAII